MQKVLLSSGGMDSYLLGMQPELAGAVHVFVDVGQAYAAKELAAFYRVAAWCNCSDVAVVETNAMAMHEHKPTGIIPFRNAELILCAAQHGEAIYMGVIADEVNSDKSPEFMQAMEAVLNISHRGQYWTEGRTFELRTPFRNTTKSDLVRQYLDAGHSAPRLYQTVSCYDGGRLHCGRCSSCFKRWVALTNALDRDAAMYAHPFEQHPGTWHSAAYWAEKMADPAYSEQRRNEVKSALAIAGLV